MNRLIPYLALVVSLAGPAFAQEGPGEADALVQEAERDSRQAERATREEERQVRQQEAEVRGQARLSRDQEQYERATSAIDSEHWDEAIAAFEDVIEAKGRRIDAALYWKAYAQNKAGRRPEALATLQDLRKQFPDSRWLRQSQALEQEVRQSGGQPPNPENAANEDLKLMALNGLVTMDAERAVPMLEKFLASNSSPRLRERALFVLCQSGSPRAREVVMKVARGGDSPDLQRKAIEYLGMFGGAESRQALGEIYASTADVEVKKAILRSFMISGEKGRVLTAARSEANPELRREAIQQLGIMGAQDELWTLYQAETSAMVKRAVVNALFIGGSADRLMELAKGEKDPQLRGEAIRHLGLIGGKKTGALLVSLYATEKEPAIKKQVLQAFFLQGNVAALIEIARNEKDPGLRRDAVGHLSHMGSKEATDFLIEILDK